MAKTVSAGRVYLGQEGSGQAQILTPFDATKFPQQEMAITEKRKEDEQKQLQDKRKNFKLNVAELENGWAKDNEFYSKEFDRINNETVNLYLKYAQMENITDVNDYNKAMYEIRAEEAALNKDIAKYNKLQDAGIQNQGIYNESLAIIQSPENLNKIMQQESAENLHNFVYPPQKVIDEAGGDIQEARNIYLRDYLGGKIPVNRFNHNSQFQVPMQKTIAEMIQTSSGSNIKYNSELGGYETTDYELSKFDKNQMREIVLTNAANNPELLKFYLTDPKLLASIKEYTGVDNPKEIPLYGEGSVYEWFTESPVAEKYRQDQYYLKDQTSSSKSFSQDRNANGGSNIVTQINEGNKEMPMEGSVSLEVTRTFGERAVKPKVKANSKVTTNFKGQQSVQGKLWRVSSNTESSLRTGEMPNGTEVSLVDQSLEVNTVPVAANDITYTVLGKTFDLKEGTPIPVELLNDKNFVQQNYNNLGYQNYASGIFLDADNNKYPLTAPAEDMKSLFSENGWHEVETRNVIKYNPDGTVSYYVENNATPIKSGSNSNNNTGGGFDPTDY